MSQILCHRIVTTTIPEPYGSQRIDHIPGGSPGVHGALAIGPCHAGQALFSSLVSFFVLNKAVWPIGLPHHSLAHFRQRQIRKEITGGSESLSTLMV